MEQTELICTLGRDTSQHRDILIAFLADFGFESFQETEHEVRAYMPEDKFSAAGLQSLFSRIEKSTGRLKWSSGRLKDKNWNEEWEKNFPPVAIDGLCRIRAPFHTPDPAIPYEIILTPRMAFGTGHHPSTFLMVRQLLKLDPEGWKVLDMGCGTGILSVLAEKMGAEGICGIDNNDWAVQNARENIEHNHCSRIRIHQGDASSLDNPGEFDLVLANINLNVLLEDAGRYAEACKPDGKILLGGYFQSDRPGIELMMEKKGFMLQSETDLEGWTCQLFCRPAGQ